MRHDKYGRPIFQEQDLFDLLYQGNLDKLQDVIAEHTAQTENIPGLNFETNEAQSITDFDQTHQAIWFMPEEYYDIDIEKHIIELCPPWDPEHSRVIEELTSFKEKNMLNLLKWLKYFVDTARKNNIVWGVGRGSSVASYVLFLLGVHKINSIKYNLDFKEFLR